MKQYFFTMLFAVSAAFANVAIPLSAHAQSEAPAALSMLPVASVVGTASVAGTVYLLERASDGARASVKVLGRAANGSAVAIGSTVTVSVIGSGVVLSAAGEVLAFVPNAIGRTLLYNEKLS